MMIKHFAVNQSQTAEEVLEGAEAVSAMLDGVGHVLAQVVATLGDRNEAHAVALAQEVLAVAADVQGSVTGCLMVGAPAKRSAATVKAA